MVVSLTGADRCGGFLYTSCAPVDTENLSAQLQDFLCQLHPNSRILLMLNPSFCVPFSPQNPSVLLPLEIDCLAWNSPFPASAVAKGINTLDFASKIVCQQGCFSPLLETQSQGIASLWTPAYFPRKWYPNCKNAV